MLTTLLEYYTSSSLFMSSSGVFLIMTDSEKLLGCKDKELEDTSYYSWVGSYVDLISTTAERAKLQPKIQLVVTKAGQGMEDQIREACAKILEITKKHLESVDVDTTFFFVNNVLVTSAEHVTGMEMLKVTLSTLCSHKDLNETRAGSTPMDWYSTIDQVKDLVVVDVSEVSRIQEEVQRKTEGASDVSMKDIEELTKLKAVTEEVGKRFGLSMSDAKDRADVERAERKSSAQPVQEESGQPEEENSGSKEKEDTENLPQPDFSEGSKIETEVTRTSGKGPEFITPKEEQTKEAEERKVSKKVNDVSAMLKFFANRADLLWFSQNETLKHLVIPKPMAFVQSLRAIIGHDVLDKMDGEDEEREDLYQKGTMTFTTFEKIYNSQKETEETEKRSELSCDRMWQFITELGLAYEIMGMSEERRILVPSHINNKTKEKFMEKIEGDNDVVIQYQFKRNAKTLGSFDDFVKIFTQKFFKEGGGGDVIAAFSEKVESKQLGAVAGVHGQIMLPDKSEKMDFLLLHYEVKVPDEAKDAEANPFTLMQRQLRVHLRPSKGCPTRSAFDALRMLDEAFVQEYPEVKRGLACKECIKQEKSSIVRLDGNLQLREYKERCNSFDHHELSIDLKTLFSKPGTMYPNSQNTLVLHKTRFENEVMSLSQGFSKNLTLCRIHEIFF